MNDLSAFHGPNAGYVLDLYEHYLADPSSVDPEMRAYFAEFSPPSANGATAIATLGAPARPAVDISAVVGAVSLTDSIREFGHLAAQLDPLGSPPVGAPELELGFHGLDEAKLASLPVEAIPTDANEGARNAADVIENLRSIYGRKIGYDFDQVQIASERAWLRDAVEHHRFDQPLNPEQKHRLLKRLTEVEGFEKFLHQTYVGQKRFSVEGTDILVPMLDVIIRDSAAAGVREVVVGMAHRGRLNVMAHVFEKPYAAILAAFEGGKGRGATAASDTSSDNGITGDVKYHLGAKRARAADGTMVEVPLVLAPNPSHLEFVNPVVEGMTRASQDDRRSPGPPTQDTEASMAILLHGDSAFPGQGIVAETLNLSGLPGYQTGGTIHIIVNNQIGFTTDVRDARSTLYAGDLAKGFEIPVVHVNADDPEACLTAVRMATAYRSEFGKDFLIDLIGYRRWGHNEGLEPTFTQPQMYATIAKHPTVRQQWADRMVAEGLITAEEAKQQLAALIEKLGNIRRTVSEDAAPHEDEPTPERGERRQVETAVSEATLQELHQAIHDVPEPFTLGPKLLRQWERRRAILDQPDGMIDWAHAEALAFAAILREGTPIRLTGQDSETGTFSQRHFVLHNSKETGRHVPLQVLPGAKASFAVYNSPLSEAAAVGFEYGYSVHAPETLVLWEAQFGDFVNGAQVLIDQFIVAARAKWQQDPALVLLLPHGYEGQGPEHSSGRLERFLQLAAEDNMRVANVTTAAQYFHLLRRQAGLLTIDRRPLVLMTPKSLLRHPLAASPAADFITGTFQPVLDDPRRTDDPEAVTRLVLCSGKVAVELEGSELRDAAQVAVARVEQLAPFQTTALRTVIERYRNIEEIYWVQEEPRNMGGWSFMESRLRALLGQLERPLPIQYIGRPERASPAEGSPERHANEQARIVSGAFAGAGERSKASGRSNGAPAANGRKKAGTATASKPTR